MFTKCGPQTIAKLVQITPITIWFMILTTYNVEVSFLPNLGKSWACKHWKFQNNYFVIFLAFLLHFFCIWVCHFGFVLSFFVIFLSFFVISVSFLCHFFVICLPFYRHFIVILRTGKWRKQHVKK